MRVSSIGWLIGYFVALFPLFMIQSVSVIHALLHSIVGLGVAVMIEVINRYYD